MSACFGAIMYHVAVHHILFIFHTQEESRIEDFCKTINAPEMKDLNYKVISKEILRGHIKNLLRSDKNLICNKVLKILLRFLIKD